VTEPEKPHLKYGEYVDSLFAGEDDALRMAREESQREGLPPINVSASEGKLLHVLALTIGARRILEVGTLGGYSAIWLARALPPGGKLISLEIDPHHADVARRNIERAGLSDRVEVRVGPALETLAGMEDGEGSFDLAFIDADKDAYVAYLEKVAPLVREGGIVLGDNTLPDAVLDPARDSGTKRYNAAVAERSDLVSIVVPMLRSDGLDGLTVSFKRRT
jgi:predicted O-methyltransferase YrrM